MKKFNFKLLSLEFRFSVLGVSIYLLLLTLLCNLGFWQLNRSEQKRQWLQQQHFAANAAVLDLNRQPLGDLTSVRYHKTIVRGHYDQEHQFLIDNQMLDGKAGYFVLTPFIIDQDQRAVLVNRGWLAVGNDRNVLPDLGIKMPIQEIKGRINQFPQVGIKLNGAEIPTAGWPSVLQVVDSRILAAKLTYDLYNFQIELDTEAAEGYRREWKTNSVIPPEKHLAYAVQWFGLALTLSGLFFWISINKRSEHTT